MSSRPRLFCIAAAGTFAHLLLVHADGQPTAPSQPVFRSFEHVQLLEDKGETSASVSVGDLNGDGLMDIVLAKGRHWPLHSRVLLNDGKGGFSVSNLGTAPAQTYSAALADVDGDGHLDVVVSNDAPDRKLVYRNDGKGHFTEIGTFGKPGWPTRYVTLADLNGDGFPDIVAANRGDFPDIGAGNQGAGPSTPVPSFVCLNDGKGHFPTYQPLPTESATSIVAADFDGDGAIDLFVPHRDGGQSIILWNDGKGVVYGMAFGDFNGDGWPDIVAARSDAPNGIWFSTPPVSGR